ncbi:hypothetical protein TcCL_NonESM13054 [Trypanosoma cruzi]|nr:hypothetical protein TcCL_NonESM13054 [Trypanosoma cruzi]
MSPTISARNEKRRSDIIDGETVQKTTHRDIFPVTFKLKGEDLFFSGCRDERVVFYPGLLKPGGSWCLNAESMQARGRKTTDHKGIKGCVRTGVVRGWHGEVEFPDSRTRELVPRGWRKIRCPKHT